MWVLGIGTEITEVARIAKMTAEHGDLFLRRVFTEGEIRHCQSRKLANEHFAGRWAAKEAVLKALGTAWSRGVGWTDIEVREASGALTIKLSGAAREIADQRGARNLMISISHCRHYAVAYALATGSPPIPGPGSDSSPDFPKPKSWSDD